MPVCATCSAVIVGNDCQICARGVVPDKRAGRRLQEWDDKQKAKAEQEARRKAKGAK